MQPLKRVFCVFVGIILSISLAELLLRVTGYANKHNLLVHKVAQEREATLPDEETGWKNRESTYTSFIPSTNKVILVTILEDGRRATEINDNRTSRPKIITIGGSFTRGHGISDNETYPWKLQEKIPKMKVLNYGVGGYGTYQSLLTLERLLPKIDSPKIVIYGFIDHHMYRNIADGIVLELISRLSKDKYLSLPYATIDKNGSLIRHRPESCAVWPLRNRLATVSLAEITFMRLKTFKRRSQKGEVTTKLLVEMNKICKKYDALLIVALFRIEKEHIGFYLDFLEKNNVLFVDCSHLLTDKVRINADAHPDEKINFLFAEKISAFMHTHNLTKTQK